MIKSFRHKGLRRFFETGDTRGINAEHARKLQQVLAVLDGAASPSELDVPGFRTHVLTGDLAGLLSITVRANWRVIFQFDGQHAHDVDLVDYH